MTPEEKWESDVLAYDPFAGDYGGPGDRVLSDKIVTARKAGECMHCRGQVVPGTRVRSRKEVFDGEMHNGRWCHDCCDAQARVNSDEENIEEAFDALEKRDQMFAVKE